MSGRLGDYPSLVREAQKKRISITRTQQKEIATMYREIADDLSDELRKHSETTLTYRWLKDYEKELRRESKTLFSNIEKSVKGSTFAVGKAVVNAEQTFYGGLCPELSTRFTDVFSSIPKRVTDELMSGGIYKDFSGLSERIWAYQKKYDKDIAYVINQGISAQKSAYELAKDLEIYLNPKAAKPWNWSKVYPHSNKVVDYNAQRLARTSVTHAYQLSFERATRDNPFITQYEWLASNGGRTCELCSSRDGQLFDKDSVPLDHPNGMCTIVAVIPQSDQEIADELAAWANDKENPALDKWLQPNGKRDIIKNKLDIIFDENKYRTFDSGEAVNHFFYYDSDERGLLAKANSKHGKWISSLSQEQRITIGDYCADGYADINSYWRKYGDWENINEKKVLSQTEALDDAISSYSLKENIKVYRAIKPEVFQDYWDDIQQLVGQEYTDAAFMSTSPLKTSTAVNKDCIMEIFVPAGKGRGAYINNLSGFQDEEYEFLLSRNSKFKIISVEETEEKLIIKMVMIIND